MPLDIGLGILVSIIASKIFSIDLNVFLVIISIFFSLLPDLDVLIGRFGINSKFAHTHRNIFHYPIIYIFTGSLVAWQFADYVMFIFIASSILHFIHDSIALGWGVKWLYPFNSKSFIIYQADIGKFFLFLTDEEVNELAFKYGKDNWIQYYYFKWHPLGIIEFAILIIVFIVLLKNLN